MRLSQALWLHGESPVDALRVALAALDGIPRHLEASLWFAGTGLMIAAVALLAGGLVCIAAAGLFAAPHAAHDLGDAISGEMPAFARVAFLGSLLLRVALARRGAARTRARAARDRGRLRPAGPARGARAGGRRRGRGRLSGRPARRLDAARLRSRSRAGRGGLLDPGARAADRSRPARRRRGAGSARRPRARRAGQARRPARRSRRALPGAAGGRPWRSGRREQRGERAPLARAHGVRARALRPLARPLGVAAGAVQPGAGLRTRLPGRQPGAHARARPGARRRRRGGAGASSRGPRPRASSWISRFPTRWCGNG